VLQWQLRAARRGLQAVAVSRPWLQERVALARYTGLPLAQLEGDAFLGAASALFARSLRDMGHVLWWRDSALPGIGEDHQGLEVGGGLDRNVKGGCWSAGLRPA
jgi:hypothetical protein